MSVFAAIDIGANSVRLKIARSVHHSLQSIHEDRVVTRLGESAFRFGVLSPEAMDATVALLRLAKAMCPGSETNIQGVRAEVQGRKVQLALKSKGSADLEIWILQKERGYFREIFGRDLGASLA